VKLRIHRNSLRLRLNRSDAERFRKTGICAESLRFGSGSQLTYTLEASSRWTVVEARYYRDYIHVLLPLHVAQQWTGSDRVSLSVDRADDRGPSLLIEKDFQCLHRDETSPNDDADAFPNPLVGDQCR
jgi:Family of unknown function (DUF7009)